MDLPLKQKIPLKDTKDEKQKEEQQAEDLISATAKGASYLIMLQFASRMLTFSLNLVVARYTSPETFGIANVNLELLSSTILFISREGFRSALVRNAENPQQILNLAYIPTALGLFTTVLTCSYYLYSITSEQVAQFPYYKMAVLLYGGASFVELCVEPLFIMALNRLYFQLRVSVEGIAVVLKCLVTFGLTLWFAGDERYSILPFAIAQFVFGTTLFVGYLGFFLYKEKSIEKLLPKRIKSENDGNGYWFDKQLLNLGTTMTSQSLLKHVLTEGDKMLISVLSSLQDKGVYAFVINYGSLIVRILFQPLEETGRTFFSKLLLSNSSNPQLNIRNKQTGANVLMIFMKFHVLLGLLFICFGVNYCSTLIDLLAGKKWSLHEGNAPGVLAIYCAYVPFMGINGVTEGFVQAVASKSDLSRLSNYMILFSIVFMTSGYVFMHIFQLGAKGLVLANMINLSVRIGYSWHFIKSYFSDTTPGNNPISVLHWFPHTSTTASFALAAFVTHWSEKHFGWYTLEQKTAHIGVGALCFVFVSAVTFYKERSLLDNMKQIRNRKLD